MLNSKPGKCNDGSDWRPLPSLIASNVSMWLLSIPYTLLLTLPFYLLIALGGGGVLWALGVSPAFRRIWLGSTSVLYLVAFVAFWYLQYSLVAFKAFLARQPKAMIKGSSLQFGNVIDLCVQHMFRRESMINSLVIRLENWSEILRDDHDSTYSQQLIHQTTFANSDNYAHQKDHKHLNLPLESNSVGPDAPLNIYTTLQLPMQEEWNSLLQQVAETSNVSNEEIEGTLMVILKIEILSGVEYYTEHRLSEPMRYLNQGVKTIPFAR